MDAFNYCQQCNPEINWLELEFMSEQDEPINGLVVTIKHRYGEGEYTQITRSGKVAFDKLAAGEWQVSVSQASLLSEVEKYTSRQDGFSSPVKERSDKELSAVHQSPKRYCLTTIGDFWDEAPQDEFLKKHHQGIDINASSVNPGFRLSHNKSYVFEVKAVRSYMPVIVDTDEFNLLNSYTFALLSQLAYASEYFNRDDGETTDSQGAIDTVISQLKRKEMPTHSGELSVRWVLEEVPYSCALNVKYYADDEVGSEGYILFNNETAIIGVRGTEPYFKSRETMATSLKWQIIKASSGLHAVVAEKVENVANSPAMKDLIITDLNAAQIAPPEFGGAYVHRGFYQYAMAFWKLLSDDILKYHANKKFYVCGHSLGGAGALILTALIKDNYHPSTLRLNTYGMPRTGTRSFVERYKNILHYRHVNNHDLVPQVPMTWVNTDLTEGLDSWDVFSSGVTLAKKMITDNDEDNYLHHGRLSQLITYQPSKQILLTPRQTQVTIWIW